MLRKFFPLVFFGVFLLLGLVLNFYLPPSDSAVSTAGVITLGILGGFRGKVGPVVGSKWKAIDYMRSYVVPSNPNTAGQQAVRAKMSALVAYGKALLTTLLQTYWDPFYSNMSGFNAFVSANYSKLSVSNKLDLDCVISQGTLEPTSAINSAQISGTDLALNWNTTISGNGLATDVLKAVVYKVASNTVHFCTSSLQRSAGNGSITVPSGVTDDDIVYVFFHRGTGADFIVSDSKSCLIAS